MSTRVVLAAAALALAACGFPATPPLIVPRPEGWDADAHYAVAERVARERGYPVAIAQPSRHRFGVYAHFQDDYVPRYGAYRITVRCAPEPECTIVPFGPRVEWVGDHWEVPDELRAELGALRLAIERGLPAPRSSR